MLFITKDGDFSNSHFISDKPARLLRITLGNLSNTELTAVIEANWSIVAQIAAQERCYMELSRGGIVRVPRN